MKTIISFLFACVSLTANASFFELISLEQEFKEFATQAINKDYPEQVEIWEEVIESKFQDVYEEMAYGKSYNSEWKKRREEKLKSFIPWSLKHADKIMAMYKDNTPKIKSLLNELQSKFPHEGLKETKVYFLPSVMTFDGKVSIVNNEIVTAFGVDFAVRKMIDPEIFPGIHLINDIPVLVAHEMAHVVHANIIPEYSVRV